MSMGKEELIRRYLVFFAAIVIAGFGVTLVTRASLGVNSIACASYVISTYFPVTMGAVVIAFNVITWLLQIPLMPKGDKKAQYINLFLQFPALVLFGFMVDVFMWLTKDFHPEQYEYGYAACVATFILGSIIISINIVMQATANVTKIACDAFVIVLAAYLKRNMGRIKLYFDSFLVAIAAIISLVCSDFTEIIGIREGTIIGVILIGPVVQLLLPHAKCIEDWILKARKNDASPQMVKAAHEAEAEISAMANKDAVVNNEDGATKEEGKPLVAQPDAQSNTQLNDQKVGQAAAQADCDSQAPSTSSFASDSDLHEHEQEQKSEQSQAKDNDQANKQAEAQVPTQDLANEKEQALDAHSEPHTSLDAILSSKRSSS